MAGISYLPGEGTAIVAGETIVLVDAPADDQICTALWRLVVGGASYDRLRAILESYGPARLPGLGIASWGQDGVVLLLRGAVQASITDDISTMRYADERRRAWSEYGPQPARDVRLWLREPSPPALPLVTGMVRSDAVLATIAETAATPPSTVDEAVAPPPSVPPVAAPPPPMDGVFVERVTPPPQPTRAVPVPSLADVWVTHADPLPPAAVPAPVAPAVAGLRPTPAVRATLCPNAHPNPPDAPVCRLCGAPIIDRDLSIVARPPLGRLDFATLGWVPLDGDILIGSNPGEQPPDGPRPVLIAHPAVSPRHIELRVRDWTVTVIDVGSQYGTSLVLPGRTAQPLLAGYPVPIVPGTVVWMAQQVPFTYVAA